MKEDRWYIDFKGSKLLMNKLNNFIMELQEQYQDSLAVTSPEIYRTTISRNRRFVSKNQGSILTNGKNTIQTGIIPGSVNLKGTWS